MRHESDVFLIVGALTDGRLFRKICCMRLPHYETFTVKEEPDGCTRRQYAKQAAKALHELWKVSVSVNSHMKK
ncbi:uncharacterized protein V6R79_004640 [Siganus canaliculatus]